MKVYRFITKISDTGIIQIPYSPTLFDKEVEIIILPKAEQGEDKVGAMDFVDNWAGFLKNEDTDKSKYDYLSNKYK